jgi:hypothetical protein
MIKQNYGLRKACLAVNDQAQQMRGSKVPLLFQGRIPHNPLPGGLRLLDPHLPTPVGLGFARVLGPTRGGVANAGNSFPF